MLRETSYGIIPLRKRKKEWWLFLIQHHKGLYWAFPKGHAEPGETPLQAAERELGEETGLQIKRLLKEVPFQETYGFTREHSFVQKTVYYFLAEVKGSVHLQPEEVYDGRWVKLEEAEEFITFPEAKRIYHEAIQHLTYYSKKTYREDKQ